MYSTSGNIVVIVAVYRMCAVRLLTRHLARNLSGFFAAVLISLCFIGGADKTLPVFFVWAWWCGGVYFVRMILDIFFYATYLLFVPFVIVLLHLLILVALILIFLLLHLLFLLPFLLLPQMLSASFLACQPSNTCSWQILCRVWFIACD